MKYECCKLFVKRKAWFVILIFMLLRLVTVFCQRNVYADFDMAVYPDAFRQHMEVLEGRLTDEKATYIEQIYANSDDEQVGFSMLDGSDMDYILLDKDGNVIRQSGEDTREGKGVSYFFMTSYTDKDDDISGLSEDELMKRYSLLVYNDKESDILTIKTLEMPIYLLSNIYFEM